MRGDGKGGVKEDCLCFLLRMGSWFYLQLYRRQEDGQVQVREVVQDFLRAVLMLPDLGMTCFIANPVFLAGGLST